MVIMRIKKCPFCGAHAVLDYYEYELDSGSCKNYFVRCSMCQTETMEMDSIEKAVAIWNQRVPERDLGESDVINIEE